MSLHRVHASDGDSRFENRFMIDHDNGLAIKILPFQEARIMYVPIHLEGNNFM